MTELTNNHYGIVVPQGAHDFEVVNASSKYIWYTLPEPHATLEDRNQWDEISLRPLGIKTLDHVDILGIASQLTEEQAKEIADDLTTLLQSKGLNPETTLIIKKK